MDVAIEGGAIWLLRLFDVAEAIDLDRARALAAQGLGARRGPANIRGPEKAGGVVLASQPLDLDLGAVDVAGSPARAGLRLFDFGAVSVRLHLEIPPGTTAPQLLAIAARIERLSAVDSVALELWKRVEHDLREALRGAHEVDLTEDYTVYEVTRVRGCRDAREALEALTPAQLLLAEPQRALAPEVVRSHLERALQYYADDAAVVGWNAALVLDPDGSRDELEVLEIATARLLELRYYDRLLARELGRVYEAAEQARGRSSLSRSPWLTLSRRAATLFVEMNDLYDRVEGALTLVGDAYTARLYREAAERFRLDEISAAVKEKLGALARVSELFEAQISERRSRALEIAVVALIVVEVVVMVMWHQ